jgi:hypothetical protein
MSAPKLHPTGLHPESLSAQMLEFMVSHRLGLLGFAAAADVIAADCRKNDWVVTTLKKTNLDDSQWVAFLETDERICNRCKAAMAAYAAGGSLAVLCEQLAEVARGLSDRRLHE